MAPFLTFPHEKTNYQWPKGVSEAMVPNNWGYICVEKWSCIFILGTGHIVPAQKSNISQKMIGGSP